MQLKIIQTFEHYRNEEVWMLVHPVIQPSLTHK